MFNPFVYLIYNYHCSAADVDYRASMYHFTKQYTTSDNVNATKCITVTIVDDDVGEANEEFRVQITAMDSRVSISGVATSTIIIDDDEGIALLQICTVIFGQFKLFLVLIHSIVHDYILLVFPAPLNMMASNVNSRSLELSWDPPDTRSTAVVITGYTAICNGNRVGNSESEITDLVVNNLIPYTTYTCAVDANFPENNIGQSTPVTATTLEEGKINDIDMYDIVLIMWYIVCMV